MPINEKKDNNNLKALRTALNKIGRDFYDLQRSDEAIALILKLNDQQKKNLLVRHESAPMLAAGSAAEKVPT